ncbi:MAG: transposase, partial [bacterium]|nr:transposase [bacterium]
RIEVNEEEEEEYLRLAGCYVIKTDVPATEMDKETIHSRYKDLSKVEQAFETLKSGLLEIRPINVRKESSVRGHVFVCLLALKVTHYLEKMLKELNFPIKYVLDTLNEIQYREIVYTDCSCIKTLPDILSDDQTRILQTLKITLPKQL